MIGRETLDDPRADPAVVRRTLADIVRLNARFGGTRAVVEALEPFFERGTGNGKREPGTGNRKPGTGNRDPGPGNREPETGNREPGPGTRDPGPGNREPGEGEREGGNVRWTLLDVGTGSGDISLAAVAAARRHGIDLAPVGIDVSRTAAGAARAAGVPVIVADGTHPPLRARSVDVIVASQVLHHLPRPIAVRWIASFDRLARHAVVLADLRRSRAAMAMVWLASFPLGMSGVTRRDAVVSLRRGYTKPEFDAMLAEAGVPAVARYRPGCRIVAAWETAGRRQTSDIRRQSDV